MRWPWSPRVPPVDHETRARISDLLAEVTANLAVMVSDLEKTADRKLPDDT